MGGNALNLQPGARLPRAQYLGLEARVLAVLRADFPTRRIEAIPAYRDKPDFGDVDVLFESDGLIAGTPGQLYNRPEADRSRTLLQYVQERFAPSSTAVSAEAVSFDFEGFQVDLMLTPSEVFASSLGYYSWNDLGNLLGHIASAHAYAKLGHHGLLLPFPSRLEVAEELVVERDWATILSAFGYDPARWAQGFDSMQDMFEFVVSSPLFSAELFLAQKQNHQARARMRKRKTYASFIAWLQAPEQAHLPRFIYPEDRRELLPQLQFLFPSLPASLLEASCRLALARGLQDRLGRTGVHRRTGLKGQPLYDLLAQLRERCNASATLKNWVAQTTEAAYARWLQTVREQTTPEGSYGQVPQ